MTYSKEFREKALKYCADGLADDAVCKELDIRRETLRSWKKLLFDTGSLEKKKLKKSGRPYKYKTEKIKELLEKSKIP